ncbi:hypothetical protein QQP08_020859 [Theobroma cacao]|nr:hypothetical protein QQP08_020859 [Theobroma cacao]
MAQSERTFTIKTTTPRTTSLHLQASLNPIRQSMHRSKTSAKKVPDEMAAHPPVEIGTRGTVGSLVMLEIEYFSRLELSCRDSSEKPHPNVRDFASSSSHSRPIVGPVVATQKKKKKKIGGSKLLPSMCSMVEISENRPVGFSGFGYRNLKSDVKKLQEFYPKQYYQSQALESDGRVCGAGLMESSSLVIRELIVPVVPTLTDPPPPLIASSF